MQATLTPSAGTTADWFGMRVAIDGNTAVVGSPNKKVGDMARHGAAWVSARSGSTWTLRHEILAADGANYATFVRLGTAGGVSGVSAARTFTVKR